MKNLVKNIWNCGIARFLLMIIASACVFWLGLELGWPGRYSDLVDRIGDILIVVGIVGFTLTIAEFAEEPKEVVYVVIVDDEEEL